MSVNRLLQASSASRFSDKNLNFLRRRVLLVRFRDYTSTKIYQRSQEREFARICRCTNAG
jgi:hypothetical protein